MGDKRHPVHKLERWTKTEYVRGVAAGQRVALLGAVIMNVMMPRLGEKTGPIIKVKFKIMKSGSTDWVPAILGGRALDCTERHGLGFVPGPSSHYFAGLDIQMERAERLPPKRRTHDAYAVDSSEDPRIFAVRASVVDSESDDDAPDTECRQLSPPSAAV